MNHKPRYQDPHPPRISVRQEGKVSHLVMDFTHQGEPERMAIVREINARAEQHALDRWNANNRKANNEY